MTDRETPWEFLLDDDDIDSCGRSAEELVIHIELLRRPRRARDSGMSDVEFGPREIEGLAGIGHLADEEPEHPEAELVEERELDVWELLERQGYTFADGTEEREKLAGHPSSGVTDTARTRLTAPTRLPRPLAYV